MRELLGFPAAVCHGPSGFVDSSPSWRSRALAVFTDDERTAGVDKAIPFLLESRLKGLEEATVVTANASTMHALTASRARTLLQRPYHRIRGGSPWQLNPAG